MSYRPRAADPRWFAWLPADRLPAAEALGREADELLEPLLREAPLVDGRGAGGGRAAGADRVVGRLLV